MQSMVTTRPVFFKTAQGTELPSTSWVTAHLYLSDFATIGRSSLSSIAVSLTGIRSLILKGFPLIGQYVLVSGFFRSVGFACGVKDGTQKLARFLLLPSEFTAATCKWNKKSYISYNNNNNTTTTTTTTTTTIIIIIIIIIIPLQCVCEASMSLFVDSGLGGVHYSVNSMSQEVIFKLGNFYSGHVEILLQVWMDRNWGRGVVGGGVIHTMISDLSWSGQNFVPVSS